jgi:hypothetical protein
MCWPSPMKRRRFVDHPVIGIEDDGGSERDGVDRVDRWCIRIRIIALRGNVYSIIEVFTTQRVESSLQKVFRLAHLQYFHIEDGKKAWIGNVARIQVFDAVRLY